MAILEIINLNKTFKGTKILNNISLKIEEGEIISIIGPSGSGKSTLLRCINNLEKIDSGKIMIGENILVQNDNKENAVYANKETVNKINQYTGMVFQDFNLFPHMTVLENIVNGPVLVNKIDKFLAINNAKKLLKKMGLENKENEYPCNLSGGQKQRVSIARMLAMEPKIICMDEPTSALDPELVGEVLSVIKNLAKEKRTMIIVTHEIKFAEEISDKVVFMDHGQILECDSTKNIFRDSKNKRLKEFLKRYIKTEDNTMEKLNVNEINPSNVFKYFKEISSIPRESGDEEKIKNYLINFAKSKNLEYEEDENYNVIIKKKTKNKFLKDNTICFQAHTDMVCEKKEDIKIDFKKDPIILYRDEEFIRANGTTLGADNGIGIALILSILENENKNFPNIEAIFTVQEETTMLGAKQIDLSRIKSNKIISLDGGQEGKILVRSAECFEWRAKIQKEYIKMQDDLIEYELEYKSFKGGHSGGDIGDTKRGNPIKLGIAILNKIEDIYIESLNGGSQVNVIPRDFKVKFFAKKNSKATILKLIEEQKKFYKDEVINLNIIKNESNRKMYTKDITNKIISFINNFDNGALEYLNNSIILSCNMAKVYEDENNIYIEYSLRANNNVLKDKQIAKIESLINKNSLKIIWSQNLKGVHQDMDNDLIRMCSDTYKRLYSCELEKIISQGVVEGGFFQDKKKDLEYICLGANIKNAHSPDEKLEIKSVERLWDFLNALIINLNN